MGPSHMGQSRTAVKMASNSSDRVVSNTNQPSTSVSAQFPPIKKRLESQRKRNSRLVRNDDPARARTLARGGCSGLGCDDARIDKAPTSLQAEYPNNYWNVQETPSVRCVIGRLCSSYRRI